MKLAYYLTAVLASAVQAQFLDYQICNNEIQAAFSKCRQFLGADLNVIDTEIRIASEVGHLSICYGDWPACDDLQKLGLTDDAKCIIADTSGAIILIKNIISPCPNPMPPRIHDKQLCTLNHYILSEYYGQLYTDVVRNNDNEKFTYNLTSQTLAVKSNGQCLEAVPKEQPNNGYSSVKTAPCDFNNDKQKWNLGAYRISRDNYNYCLKVDITKPSSVVTIAACEYRIGVESEQYFAECSTIPNYVHITSTRGKRLSEFYTSLFLNDPVHNLNEVFLWDSSTQMFKLFKTTSVEYCLDSYLDESGKYKVHTYPCDVNNPNQKWTVHADTKQIEHATHKGQCLDGDPTNAKHLVQMWECGTDNPNQQWNIEAYSG